MSRGGARPNSGPKPKPAKLLKRKLQEHGAAEAEQSFSWLCTWRDDKTVPIAIRKECAIEVMNRVLGKPTQPIGGDQHAPLQVVIRYADTGNSSAGAALSAEADQAGA